MNRLPHLKSVVLALLISVVFGMPVQAQPLSSKAVLLTWYQLVLELVRHTPTYSPPVASRAFAYLGVTAYEASALGDASMHSLAGQLKELSPLPDRIAGVEYADAIVMHAALAEAVRHFFGNTGPSGQRAMKAMDDKLGQQAAKGITDEIRARSDAYGRAIALHIVQWSSTDGGAVVENMGFPMDYRVSDQPGRWVPTSLIVQQQKPLLPDWGNNRTFVLPEATRCDLPPPPEYSEDPASEFYQQAIEVYQTSHTLTSEQKTIAHFWSDDPMLSPTPPGHWVAIVLDIAERDSLDTPQITNALVRLGLSVADGFIGCWHSKYHFDLIRPLTYIRAHIDPDWEALLITPPFPEYPSGHSTQSGAAAATLTAVFGEDFAFEDDTHLEDGIPTRQFASFWAAAEEAAISRLYGGIHFRAAIDQGLAQGKCIGAYINALETLGVH